ncbi:MAG: hydrolase [Rubritepida sp.]|nr:hydrolase [Rubritepida sp.]
MGHIATTGIIDSDVHPAVPGMRALLPYFDPHWREVIEARGVDGLDLAYYPPNAPVSARPDWRVPGQKPGSDLAGLQTNALDAFGLSRAICNCLYGGPAMYSEDLGAAICRATNGWIAEEWLNRDDRLRASIVIPIQNAELAVDEIERWAPDKRFVQILVLASNEALLGRRQNWPIFRAAEKHGLPIGIHAGSAMRHAPTANGWPSTLYEEHVSMAQTFQSQLLSLIAEGAFTKFPDLRVVLLESGISWLPNLFWRSIKMWRGMRKEIPWVDRSPAAIVRDRVRFTLQPLDLPPDQNQVDQLLEQIGSDDIFLFSTDYPHWRFDGGDPMPSALPKELLRKAMRETPLATYPRLRETV